MGQMVVGGQTVVQSSPSSNPSGSTIEVDGGAPVLFGPANRGGVYDENSVLTNGGLISVDAGSVTPVFMVAGLGGTFEVNGSLASTGTVDVRAGSGGAAFFGIAAAGLMTDAGVVTVEGSLDDAGALTLAGGSGPTGYTLNVGGLMYTGAVAAGSLSVSGTMSVEGSVTLGGGSGTIYGSGAGAALTDSGTLVNTGSIVLDGGAGNDVGDGGGGASLTVSGSLDNAGDIRVGGGGAAFLSTGGGSRLTVAGTLTDGGTIEVASGGSAQFETSGRGGGVSVSGLLNGGGSLDVASGASLDVTSTGILDMSGAVTVEGTLDDAGTFMLRSGGALSVTGQASIDNQSIIEAGASITVGAGGYIVLDAAAAENHGGTTIEASGTLEQVRSQSAGAGIYTLESGGLLRFDTGLSMLPQNTIDLQAGGTIDFAGVTDITSAKEVGQGGREVLELTTSPNNAVYKLTLGTSLPYFSVQTSSDGQEVVASDVPCFLRGTLIRTPRGEVPVEALRAGDTVLTLRGARRRLRWVGSGRTRVTAANAERCAPVVVRAGAIAPNVPARDLHLTRGHSLYLDGFLFPVEELVNHRSILRDRRPQVIEFYHLELASHDVLVAEWAAVESYRPDGNERLFANAGARPARKSMRPCAPILHEGPKLISTWQRLSARAGLDPALLTTEDADLHLMADGKRLAPVAAHGDVVHFSLPHVPGRLRIASRSVIPAAIGLGQDQRRIGVALRRIVLSEDRFSVGIDWNGEMTDGFHPPEPGPRHCWTDGDGGIAPGMLRPFERKLAVALHLSGRSRYPLGDLVGQGASG